MSTLPSSASSHHTISVVVSDEEHDNVDPRARLVRARRKRRKQPLMASRRWKKNVILHTAIRKFLKWWPFILFIPAVGLLVFEAWRTFGSDHRGPVRSQMWALSMGLNGSLDSVDPVMRVVNGGSERCLKLLPTEQLENLEIPSVETPSFPVTRVVYISDTDRSSIGGNATLTMEPMESSRFNLFSGYQTLAEQEQSFKVNQTAMVHCGFYSENGGFKISDEDKNYMRACEVVVSTCAFGGGDDLYQPIGMSKASLTKVCYVAFWDEITLKTQESDGHQIDDDHMIGKWRVVVVRDLPFVDQRLNGKIPKMLGHRLFPQARYSIWVDSKSQFRRDPLGVLETLLWRTNSALAISEHGARSSIYDEGEAVVRKHKATPEEVAVQLSQYHQDGFPDDRRFNGKKALAEASVIVREHTPLTNLLMCLWFNEVVRFTSRDQLSFPYVLRQLRVLKNVNFFPVCTRKDLVNSMGHKRKARITLPS